MTLDTASSADDNEGLPEFTDNLLVQYLTGALDPEINSKILKEKDVIGSPVRAWLNEALNRLKDGDSKLRALLEVAREGK